MNRRAIVLHFIVTVLLALIIFIPACLFVSKFFRVSEQAAENFPNFVNALEEFSTSTKEKDNFLLIMDKRSFLAVFKEAGTLKISSTEERVPVGRLPAAATVTTKKVFNSPPECTGYPCACLCREFTEEEVESGNMKTITYQCTTINCQKMEASLQESWALERGEDDPRRYSLQLQKGNGLIAISTR